MKVLVVAAHPDDEVLGVGGTIARHVSVGDQVYTLILGEGKTSRTGVSKEKKKQEVLDLKKEALSANATLGVEKVFFSDIPDNKFDSIPLLDIIQIVEKHIKELQPEIIYTHYEFDLNIDHKLTFQAVLTAARPIPGSCVKKLCSFEVLSSTEWAGGDRLFSPTVYTDISKYLDKKIESMKQYASELKEFPHPRSLEGIKILAGIRGIECGLESAEAIKLIRSIEG